MVVVLSCRYGSSASARLNPVVFSRKTNPQILQPPPVSCCTLLASLCLTRDSTRSAESIPRADNIFLFFTASSMSSLVLFLPSEARASRRVQCESPEGCEELLTFHCEHWVCGGAAAGSLSFFSLLLFLFFISFIPFVSSINDNSIQSVWKTVKARHIHRL